MENFNFKTLGEFEKSMRQAPKTQLSEEYTGNRNLFDDVSKREKYKESIFDGKSTTTDFITGETLHKNRQATVNKYGVNKANYHTGQVDHINPLEQVHSTAKKIPFLTDEDVRIAANREWNYRFTQSHFNQSKQSKTNFEMAKKSFQDGKYEEGAKLISDGITSNALVTAELGARASKNAGELAVKTTYKTIHDTAKSISPKLTVEIKQQLGESVKNLKQNIGEDLSAAAVPMTISAVNALVCVTKGEKSAKEAGKEVAVQTGAMVVTEELKKFGINTANQAIKQSGIKLLQQTAKTNMVANAVAMGFMVKDSVVSWIDGKINDEEFVEQVARTGTLLAAQSMGAVIMAEQLGKAIGSTVIPIPVVGAIIGGIAASVACECMFSLMDAAKNHIVEDKRNLVAKIASEALEEMNYQRKILQEYLEDEKLVFERNICYGFDAIIDGMYKNDANAIAGGLNVILGNFDKKVAFATEKEFDDFFMDENAVLKL